MLFTNILDTAKDTPLLKLDLEEPKDIDLFVKLEYLNPTGSVKDRAAAYVIERGLKSGEIDRDTTIIESSSGNFGIALSAYCKRKNLGFVCVIDPHISPINEYLIRSMGARVIKVTELDENGGYLLTRIRKVRELTRMLPNSYWVNQYKNPHNAQAYYTTLGTELCNELDRIDYVFLGVSSGGTITGISRRIKQTFQNAKIVAVDIEGSIIFGGPPQKRYIPGIGAGRVPEILQHARIDDVCMISEIETIESCHTLLREHNLFVGGSSGSVIAGIKKYFSRPENQSPAGEKKTVVTIFPDRGDRYINTVFNSEWADKLAARYARPKQAVPVM